MYLFCSLPRPDGMMGVKVCSTYSHRSDSPVCVSYRWLRALLRFRAVGLKITPDSLRMFGVSHLTAGQFPKHWGHDLDLVSLHHHVTSYTSPNVSALLAAILILT